MEEEREKLIYNLLNSKGESYKQAIEEASKFLLLNYFEKWREFIPIELNRLAYTLGAKIIPKNDINGEAILLPYRDGFLILVKTNQHIGRYRMSIAHELGHTLFFTSQNNKQERIIPYSQQEEFICFDLARHLLAPKYHLETLGFFDEVDPKLMFLKLTGILFLSRPIAARVMLADHMLVKGIGGRWCQTENEWKLVKGYSAATPTLSEYERKKLRSIARDFLKHPNLKKSDYNIIFFPEISDNGIFVIITEK